MTDQELAKLLAVLRAAYPNTRDAADPRLTLQVWRAGIGDLPYAPVRDAVTHLIRNQLSDFHPSISAVRQRAVCDLLGIRSPADYLALVLARPRSMAERRCRAGERGIECEPWPPPLPYPAWVAAAVRLAGGREALRDATPAAALEAFTAAYETALAEFMRGEECSRALVARLEGHSEALPPPASSALPPPAAASHEPPLSLAERRRRFAQLGGDHA